MDEERNEGEVFNGEEPQDEVELEEVSEVSAEPIEVDVAEEVPAEASADLPEGLPYPPGSTFEIDGGWVCRVVAISLEQPDGAIQYIISARNKSLGVKTVEPLPLDVYLEIPRQNGKSESYLESPEKYIGAPLRKMAADAINVAYADPDKRVSHFEAL